MVSHFRANEHGTGRPVHGGSSKIGERLGSRILLSKRPERTGQVGGTLVDAVRGHSTSSSCCFLISDTDGRGAWGPNRRHFFDQIEVAWSVGARLGCLRARRFHRRTGLFLLRLRGRRLACTLGGCSRLWAGAHVLSSLRGVPVVFDGIVGSTGEVLGDLSPFVSVLEVARKEGFFLLARPGTLVDHGVELVVPALAALLAVAPLEVRTDDTPPASAELGDQSPHLLVLLGGPFASSSALLSVFVLVLVLLRRSNAQLVHFSGRALLGG